MKVRGVVILSDTGNRCDGVNIILHSIGAQTLRLKRRRNIFYQCI